MLCLHPYRYHSRLLTDRRQHVLDALDACLEEATVFKILPIPTNLGPRSHIRELDEHKQPKQPFEPPTYPGILYFRQFPGDPSTPQSTPSGSSVDDDSIVIPESNSDGSEVPRLSHIFAQLPDPPDFSDPNLSADVELALDIFERPDSNLFSYDGEGWQWKGHSARYFDFPTKNCQVPDGNISSRSYSTSTATAYLSQYTESNESQKMFPLFHNPPAAAIDPCLPTSAAPHFELSTDAFASGLHIKDRGASFFNTSLWTGSSSPPLAESGLDDATPTPDHRNNARPSARIWIVVPPMYRAQLEAGLDSELSAHSPVRCVNLPSLSCHRFGRQVIYRRSPIVLQLPVILNLPLLFPLQPILITLFHQL
ncbi:hypothetical protein P7C70_g9144, partial [Phenoliferia sp. Uapishka_3]